MKILFQMLIWRSLGILTFLKSTDDTSLFLQLRQILSWHGRLSSCFSCEGDDPNGVENGDFLNFLIHIDICVQFDYLPPKSWNWKCHNSFCSWSFNQSAATFGLFLSLILYSSPTLFGIWPKPWATFFFPCYHGCM